jgi:hypothetical protein
MSRSWGGWSAATCRIGWTVPRCENERLPPR